MVQNIREAFIENLETVDWMDSQTKQAAKEKVRGLRNSCKNSLPVLPDWIKGLENFTIVNYDLQETWRYSHWKKLGQSNSITENTKFS